MIAQRQLLSVVIEDVKCLRRLGQKREVDEGRSRGENGAAPFDADVEKDVGRTGEDEIGRQTEQPENNALDSAHPTRVGSNGDHITQCSSGTGPRIFARDN